MDNFLITFSINILFSTCLLHSILASTALKPQSYCCWGTWYIGGRIGLRFILGAA